MEKRNSIDFGKIKKEDIDSMDSAMDDILDGAMDTPIEDVASSIGDSVENDVYLGSKPNVSSKNTSKNENYFLNRPKLFDEKTLEERMSDIYEEFKADTTISLSNIREVAFHTAAIKGRWCSRLMAERVNYRRLKENLDTLIEEIGKMVDSKAKTTSYLSAKMNRDSLINNDENVKDLRKRMYESKQIQDYLTFIYECVGDLGYVVKNSLDVINLERGL